METLITHKDIIERCVGGDQSAQLQLYNLYSRQMFSVCLRIIQQREDSEDILQESFITAFNALETFRGDATFGAWLKRIVINKSLNFLKKKKIKFQEMKDDTIEIEEVQVDQSQITVEDIKKTTEELPLGYRLVFTLYMFEEMTHKEIAEHLEISVNTSKSQLNRAKKKLREIIKERHYEGAR